MSELKAILRNKKMRWLLAGVFFLLFFRLGQVDMLGDDAHYSARAIGMADFMFGDEAFQPTPLQWFTKLPWWYYLSFHDHPRLLFVIQHFFLSLHVSSWFAKLPYALMTLGAVLVTYAWVRRLYNERTALVAALLLAGNAQFIWIGRVAYLEGGVVFFLSLATYYFVRFLSDQRYWWRLGIALGFVVAVKFTTFFLPLAFIIFLALKQRAVFRTWRLYGAMAIVFLFFSPVLVYNLMMYIERGHFSVQFARLLGQQTPWHFSNAVVTGGWLSAPGLLFNSLGGLISWPYLVVVGIALLYSGITRKITLPLVAVLCFLLQQLLIGQGGYVLAVSAIFFAPLVAIVYGMLEEQAKKRIVLQAGGIVFLLYLLFFVVMSHTTLSSAETGVGWIRSDARSKNYGVSQLDSYLSKIIQTDTQLSYFDPYGEVKIRQPSLRGYLTTLSAEELERETASSRIILFDGNINWFSRVWLFERRRFYDNVGVVSLNEPHLLNQLKINSFYLVVATEFADREPSHLQTPSAATVEKLVLAHGITPQVIRRSDGQIAFNVYYVENAAALK